MFSLSPRHAAARMLIATLTAMLAVALLTPSSEAWWQRMIIGWDSGALTLVVLAWTVILRADSAATRKRAGSDDPGRHVVFVIALVASLFSLFAAAFVLKQVRTMTGQEQQTWTILTLGAIALSWAMTHTAYTLRYAHLYYRGGGRHGLQFPGDEAPADIDFAYFAFTVGMCFQVSDVTVSTTVCRRAVLLHAVLSFVYNTMILALALNLVFGLMS
ncbi:DUF1345 domain-containing protein [soil metagenome]